MSFDIFRKYGLDKIRDCLTENCDYKDNDISQWKLVKVKDTIDSDGFTTDYAWYTNGDKHIFMFGDIDITEPDEDYADWEAQSEQEASDWFDNYEGFTESDPWDSLDDDTLDDSYTGNPNFLNEGFTRVFGNELELED